MAEIDARIPLMAQTAQPITVNTLMQMRQIAQQRQAQNALRQIYSTPGAIGPDGMPTQNAMRNIMAIDPRFGMQLADQASQMAQHRAAAGKDAIAIQQAKLKAAQAPTVAGYEAQQQALANGATQQQAQRAAQDAFAAARQQAIESGVLGDGANELLPPTYNPALGAGIAMTPNQQAGLQEKRIADARADARMQQIAAHEQAMLGIANAHLGLSERAAARADANAQDGQQTADALNQNPQFLDYVAAKYNQTGQLPPLGMKATALRTKILERAAQMNSQAGIAPADAATNQMEGKAQGQALAALDRQQALVGGFERTADKNADLALSASAKVDRTGVPAFNKWLLAGKTGTGSVEAANFNAANNSFVEEYAKVMSGASGGGVAATDSARQRAHEILNTSMTPDQYRTNVALLKKEMQNRLDAMNEQRDSIRDSLKKTSGGSSQNKTLTYDPATGTFK